MKPHTFPSRSGKVVAVFYLLSTDAVSDKGRLAMAEEKDQVESTEQQEEQTEQETPLKDRISVDVEDAGTLRKKVKVTVPREVISERLDKQFKELRGEAALPGFRKGHAPRVLIEKRFGKDVTDEVRTAIVAESYDAAVEKESLDVLGQPDLDPKTIELPTEGNLEFSCEVEIKPQFEVPEHRGHRGQEAQDRGLRRRRHPRDRPLPRPARHVPGHQRAHQGR